MNPRLPDRALVAIILVAVVGFAGCKPTPHPPSEAEVMVRQVLAETFVGDAENWFAVEKSFGKLRLVELHRPSLGWREEVVSETEQMNGVTVKATMWVNCHQFRRYDGQWSEWQQGAGSAGGVANVLLGAMGPLAAQWSAHLQKKNGQWTVNFGGIGSQYQRDRNLLLRLVQGTPR